MIVYDEFIRFLDNTIDDNYDISRFDRLIESDGVIDNIKISLSKIRKIRKFYENTNDFNRSKILGLINNNIDNIDRVLNIINNYYTIKP